MSGIPCVSRTWVRPAPAHAGHPCPTDRTAGRGYKVKWMIATEEFPRPGCEVYGLVSRQGRHQAAPHINMTPDLSMGTTL